jgi:adenosylhomocysteinase
MTIQTGVLIETLQ